MSAPVNAGGARPRAIGIDVSRAIGEPTGVGVYALNLVKGLALLDRETKYVLYPGFGPYVHPEYPDRARLDLVLPPNFQVYRGPLPAFPPAQDPAEATNGQSRVGIVHSTGYAAPDVRPAKLIMTVYDLTFRTMPHLHMPANIEHCERGMRDGVQRAQMFVTISKSTKADLMRSYDVAAERIKVVSPGIDPRFTEVRDPDKLEKLLGYYRLDRPFILFVGTNEPRKNLGALLRAFHALKSDVLVRDYLLVIAGASGWLNHDVQHLVRQFGLETGVRFLGYVSGEDLPGLYTACDVFVYPSLYEGFGLPVAEAMACGAPVITSSVSSLPEMAGNAAITIDPSDVARLIEVLRTVLTLPSLRRELRARSLERSKLFSLERMAREMVGVYAQVA